MHGTMMSQRLFVGALLLFVGVLIGGDAAYAQECTVGDYLGPCTSDIGDAGCCPTANSIQWCEGNIMCGIDCSGNTGNAGCCTASGFSGCESPAVEACVCSIDDYCCDFLFGAWDETCVQIATIDCGACAGGGAPATQCGWLAEESYYDCRETASADPSGVHPRSCGATCTAQCGGKQCGSDGCGGSCGTCSGNATCSAQGQCITSCTPQCAGKQCGSDGCGGTCGQCTSTETCVSGQCEDNSCVPQCAGRECGSNGCGGSCGQCTSTQTCVSGQCEDSSCVPQCGGRECGDNGCGGSCGTCVGGETCSANGQCGPAACVPACSGKQCGDDGCGGSCGACPVGSACQAGVCATSCVGQCTGKTCGDDGCGGSCGTCSQNETCTDGACVSACSCAGRACGDDGCGRVCGYCIAGETCNATTYQCDPNTTTPEPTEGGEVIGSQSCPTGQVWSAYAGACVLDVNGGGASGRSTSGCAAGGASVLGLLGLLLARRRTAQRG